MGFRDSLTSNPVFVYTNALLATENGTRIFERFTANT